VFVDIRDTGLQIFRNTDLPVKILVDADFLRV
jgi:hypothetical protein